ncbi:hypothetical protein BV22DRAFT_861814 [Leucogyrophana mollusca]|uniref:Uncharacterized protein n=1 Tax=Leucogyrophana mollusca TaxID=85980 RepID=A0ACB8B2H7_9AGAM|nr:hypothetical protein BV22DRAFT_861814 [Leucogyrophana mollusca]
MFFKLKQAAAAAALLAISLPHITVARDIVTPQPAWTHTHLPYKLRAHVLPDQSGDYQDFTHTFESGGGHDRCNCQSFDSTLNDHLRSWSMHIINGNGEDWTYAFFKDVNCKGGQLGPEGKGTNENKLRVDNVSPKLYKSSSVRVCYNGP